MWARRRYPSALYYSVSFHCYIFCIQIIEEINIHSWIQSRDVVLQSERINVHFLIVSCYSSSSLWPSSSPLRVHLVYVCLRSQIKSVLPLVQLHGASDFLFDSRHCLLLIKALMHPRVCWRRPAHLARSPISPVMLKNSRHLASPSSSSFMLTSVNLRGRLRKAGLVDH